jgi:hypothetical protein
VRIRTETRTRRVPITRDGKTVMGNETYTVTVPVPPADLDRYVRNAVLCAAGLVLAACITWSTASIGNLLTHLVTPAAAYTAAGIFDLVWISCTALEWLARHDPARAKLPRRAGYGALLVAMGAITMDGKVAGYLTIGLVGATVSALAKGLWTVLLASTAMPLDPLTQQWVDAQRAEAGAQLSMIPVRRELARAEGLVEAERIALRMHPDADPESPEESVDGPDGVVLPMRPGPMSIADAVRTAVSHGIHDPDRVLSYVRKTADPQVRTETVERYLRTERRQAP